MIRHAWSVLCTRAITDSESRNISLLEVLEQINIPAGAQFPLVAPIQSDFVSFWYRSNPNQPERGTCRISVVTPNNQAREATQQTVDLTVYQRSRTIARSAGITLDAPGIYQFIIDLRQEGQQEWENVAHVPVSVVTTEQLAATPVRPAVQ